VVAEASLREDWRRRGQECDEGVVAIVGNGREGEGERLGAVDEWWVFGGVAEGGRGKRLVQVYDDARGRARK
jgi:hypothetical protein